MSFDIGSPSERLSDPWSYITMVSPEKIWKEVKRPFDKDMPEVPESGPMPTITDPAIKEAADRERRAALLRKGRASTLLTDQNTLGEPLLAKKSLLGG